MLVVRWKQERGSTGRQGCTGPQRRTHAARHAAHSPGMGVEIAQHAVDSARANVRVRLLFWLASVTEVQRAQYVVMGHRAVLIAALVAVAGGSAVRAQAVAPSGSHSPASRECRAGQLRLATFARPGITEDIGIGIRVQNASATSCVLRGVPFARARLSTGRWVPVPRDPNTSYLPPGADRAEVSKRAPAFVEIDIPEECGVVNGGPPYYAALTLRIAGRTWRLTRLKLPARCARIFVSPYIPS
jgi:hypothetical protein